MKFKKHFHSKQSALDYLKELGYTNVYETAGGATVSHETREEDGWDIFEESFGNWAINRPEMCGDPGYEDEFID